MEIIAILKALEASRVDDMFSNIIRNIYGNETATVKHHSTTTKIKIGRGVQQGDTLSQMTVVINDRYVQGGKPNQKCQFFRTVVRILLVHY